MTRRRTRSTEPEGETAPSESGTSRRQPPWPAFRPDPPIVRNGRRLLFMAQGQAVLDMGAEEMDAFSHALYEWTMKTIAADDAAAAEQVSQDPPGSPPAAKSTTDA